MSTSDETAQGMPPLPAGTWHVDAAASELAFAARGMFGLAQVRGTFGEFEGTLEVDGSGAHGNLQIQATTLDTKNARRDTHLRSADFFDVENHPVVSFELTSISSGAGDSVVIDGVLRIRDNALPVSAPATVQADADGEMTLRTTLDVDRAEAGVGWSKMGMVRGKAHLNAAVRLTREA